MIFNFLKRKQRVLTDNTTPRVEISEDGVLSVTTTELLKNKAIKRQYELLQTPEYRKLCQRT